MALKIPFYCATLHTSTLIVGWLSLIYTIIIALSVTGTMLCNEIPKQDAQNAIVTSNNDPNATVTSNNDQNVSAAINNDQNTTMTSNSHNYRRRRAVFNWDKYTLFLLIICLYVSIIVTLLYGTYKGRPGFLMPYIVFSGLKVEIIILTVIYALTFEMVHYKGEMRLVTWITMLLALLYTAISISFWCVVLRHYRELQTTTIILETTIVSSSETLEGHA